MRRPKVAQVAQAGRLGHLIVGQWQRINGLTALGDRSPVR
jgi:hypothetical protein